MLQIAKNFEQCEKAKAVMQQAKGSTKHVNHTGARKSSKLEQNGGIGHSGQSKSEKDWEQSQSSCQGKIYLSVLCRAFTLSLYMPSFKQAML